MLRVSGLTCDYGPVRALAGVDLEVAQGSITAVLGANGAGKTTLLRTLSGLVRPSGGSARFEERELTRMAVEEIVRLGLVHVPEGRGVIAELTVEENLRLGSLVRGGDGGSLADAYALFPPLERRRRQPAASLSGGERQMLSLARALLAGPRLLLLDEPSLGLAPKVVAELMAVVKSLARERQLAVLLVEQNARSALSIADHAVLLHLGKVVAAAPAAQLLADEKLLHAYLGY